METSSAGAGSGAQEARKGKKKKKAQQGEGGSGSLPPHLEELRSRVICDMDAPKQVRGGGGMGGVEGGRVARKVQWLRTHALQYSGAFAALGVDNSMTLERFRRELTVEIVSQSADGHDLVFDLVGIDAALANAFRRILIAEVSTLVAEVSMLIAEISTLVAEVSMRVAEVPTMAIEKVLMANNTSLVQDEVPTMAIEKVFMANNTSLVQDEVLSHRLGLVPIAVDPRLFDFPSEDGMASESNTIVFKLDYKCTRNPPADGSRHGTVQSKHLVWQPNGSTYPPDRPTKFTSFGRPQSELHDFATRPPAPTYPDITLARLRPGQAIELEAHAVKGIGRTHAKWSPVATASYRMLPEVSPTACCQSGPLVGGRMAAAVGHWLEGGLAAAVGHWRADGCGSGPLVGGRMAAAVGHWRADGCGSGPLEGGWLRQWAIGGRMAAAVGHWLEGGWLRQWAIGGRMAAAVGHWLEGGWLRQWAIGGRMAAAVGHWRADGCGSGPLEGGWLRQWAIGGRMAAAVGHWRADGCGSGPLEGGWLRQWAIGWRADGCGSGPLEGGWLRQWAIGWRADGCGSGPLVGGRMAAAVGHWLEGGWLRQWAIGWRVDGCGSGPLEGGWLRQWAIGWRADGCGSGPLDGGRMAAAVGHWMEGGWVRLTVEGQMVVFRKAVEGEMAEQLVAKCPMNVFDIEDMGNGIQRATAPRARNCTVCRECIREEGWGDYIQLRRKRDHFIFSVESTGALPPNVLFTEAVKLLESKARRLATETDRL
ncbi:unnamed protein product [Closterium sp. NIES-64]|nr:unnamed protein product [Closterium sp. NIES-64]